MIEKNTYFIKGGGTNFSQKDKITIVDYRISFYKITSVMFGIMVFIFCIQAYITNDYTFKFKNLKHVYELEFYHMIVLNVISILMIVLPFVIVTYKKVIFDLVTKKITFTIVESSRKVFKDEKRFDQVTEIFLFEYTRKRRKPGKIVYGQYLTDQLAGLEIVIDSIKIRTDCMDKKDLQKFAQKNGQLIADALSIPFDSNPRNLGVIQENYGNTPSI